MADRELILGWSLIIGCCAIGTGAWLFVSSRDGLRRDHIIAVVAIVVEQQQVAPNCITVVTLAPGINATVTESWSCDRSLYTPPKLVPVCHKWQDLQDFSMTSWDSSHEKPECQGYQHVYGWLIAGKVLLGTGVTVVASILVATLMVRPCFAMIKRWRASGHRGRSAAMAACHGCGRRQWHAVQHVMVTSVATIGWVVI